MEKREKIKRVLSERLEAHDKSRRATQERLEEICKGLEASINEFENRASSELCEKFTVEDRRLQNVLADLQSNSGGDSILKSAQRAKAELLVVQCYDVVKSGVNEERQTFDVSSLYKLKVEKKDC